MQKEHLEILRSIELFSHLPTADREGLFSAFSLIELPKDEILFIQGDLADALYIVASGSLLIVIDKDNDIIEVVGKKEIGDMVGEIGFFMNSPRFFTVKASEHATLLKLTKSNFDSFISAHPKAIYHLLVRDILRKTDLFRYLSQEALDKLSSVFSLMEMEKNEILFHQGDRSDMIYVVLSGYLSAVIQKANRKTEIIGKITQGELIGEMGALTDKPRALTIKTLTRSKLLKLSKEDFISFVKANPDALYPMWLSTIKRAQLAVNILSEKKSNSYVAAIPTNYQTDIDGFIRELKQFDNDNKKKIIFLTSDEINKIYLKVDLNGLVKYIEQLENTYSFIVMVLTPHLSQNVVQILMEKVSSIMIVGSGDAKRHLSDFSAQILENPELDNLPRVLVLSWSKFADIQRTSIWLKQADFKLHFHVIKEDVESYERVLRFIRKQLVGLVLGGGGFRAWFHLGVIKALEEKKIPIDMIGGTSAGAGIGACYLKFGGGENLIEATQRFSNSLVNSVSFGSFTFPMISFYSATPATKTVQTIFDQDRIENFKIPFFAISCNINKNAEVVHNTGNVWQALRATCAIPFLFPPLVSKGNLLYDGGLVNNLPVDQMRDLMHDGIVLASDLGMNKEDDVAYNFPPMLSPGKILLSKLHLTKAPYIFPPFFDTAIKATLMGAVPRYRNNIQLADYYIHSDFSGCGLVYVDKKLWRKLLELGYQSTMAALENWPYSL